jgi:hypothetical protein
MDWTQRVFIYCERGQDASFWAEPLNAITNGAFLIAATSALVLLQQQPDHRRQLSKYFLVLLVFIIGIGSFLFHTFATRWAMLADVAPIGIFMLGYFGFALHRLLGLNLVLSILGLAGFVGLLYLAGEVKCWNGQIGFNIDMPSGARGACLNGSVGYFPALMAMLGIGGLMMAMRRRGGALVLAAGLVFTVSITFRSIDMELCRWLTIAGSPIGTHFLWHLLNAVTLYLLLRAAILFSGPIEHHELRPPRPVRSALSG